VRPPFPTPESDSECSLSGFETVASHSQEEDNEEEEEEELSVLMSGSHSTSVGMSQEDCHGNTEPQTNGDTQHRFAVFAPATPKKIYTRFP